jgi:hypothetical protein
VTGSNGSSPQTEVVHASELANVIQRIFELRHPDAMPEYRKELAKYKRRLGKRTEETYEKRNDWFSKTTHRGFRVTVMGQDVSVLRPVVPKPLAWAYSSYERFMGSAMHASQNGLLANAEYNRDIRPGRVDEYQREMANGRWRDLLSDPISVTEDGHVLNGQHRIAAASRVDWNKAGNDPAFLVIWNVKAQEALLADGSRRTPRDEKTIATKLAT